MMFSDSSRLIGDYIIGPGEAYYKPFGEKKEPIEIDKLQHTESAIPNMNPAEEFRNQFCWHDNLSNIF